MKSVFISIFALSFLFFNAHAAGVSQGMKSIQDEAVQHKKDQKNELAEAYKQYQATKAAAATAYRSANLQAEKDYKKAKELIAQQDKDFKTKYNEIKINLAKKKFETKKDEVISEAASTDVKKTGP